MLKKFFSILFILMSVFTLKLTEAAVEENRAYFPPVLMYHDIKLMPVNSFDVTIKDFRQQLQWLKSAGYKTLSMEEFIACIQENREFPQKSILITFDDGYEGAYLYAVPELKSRDMKATFFINPWYIGKIAKNYPYMKEEQIKDIADNPLFSIESHTTKHFHLDKLDSEKQLNEFVESKEYIENLIGHQVQAVSYPFGDYNAEVIDNAKKAGYEVAFAIQDRGLFGGAARFSIPRIYMCLELCGNDQQLFKKYIKDYKKMPTEAFIERWRPLNN